MRNRAPVIRSTVLETFALEGAHSDAQTGIGHGHIANHPGVAKAENEFVSDQRPNDTVQTAIMRGWALFWSEGPGGGHYDNMIGAFTEVGCGVHLAAGRYTIVQDFQ